jgi:hypothetical protein
MGGTCTMPAEMLWIMGMQYKRKWCLKKEAPGYGSITCGNTVSTALGVLCYPKHCMQTPYRNKVSFMWERNCLLLTVCKVWSCHKLKKKKNCATAGKPRCILSNFRQSAITTWQMHDLIMCGQHQFHLIYNTNMMYGNRYLKNMQLLLLMWLHEVCI